MFGSLSKLANKMLEKFDALTNESELIAVVAAAVLVAAADGKIEDSEKEVAFKAIAEHESLKGFRPSTIRSHFDNFVKLINADRQLAEEELYEKLEVIRDRVARIRVIGIATQIANADGEFSATEKAVVEKIRKLTA